jgi:mercuric ion binding protein
MKTSLILILLACMIAACTTATINKKSEFEVSGNCNMCKETIEDALDVKGVADANWNKDTKIMTVNYDSTAITLQEIKKKIADAGYDNDMFKSSDSAYQNLHECCHYERKP